MRNERGNVILTALFVAVFLFFLSIALLWTNRQDIALSLAMEHKMKAEAAARSGAMRVYTNLRAFDQPLAAMHGTVDSGAAWKAQLLELPSEGDRGPVVLLQCRGTSGPLSSYYTMHLLKTELGAQLPDDRGRMLGFLSRSTGGGGSVESEEAGSSGEETSAPAAASGGGAPLSANGKVLYGDFELKEIDLGLDGTAEKFASYQGPLFASGPLGTPGSPLGVNAYLPVFSPLGATPMAYGPLILTAPAPSVEHGLSVMTYQSEQFQWEAIPFPEPEPVDLDPPPRGVLELEAPPVGGWNTLAAKAIGDSGTTARWRDSKPGTADPSEALDLAAGSPFEIDSSGLIEWSTAAKTPNQRGYVLQGAIAAHGQIVYSFGWEYLYRHYNGPFMPAPIPPIVGNTMTRWPCVRSYDLADKKWSTVWSSLQDNGDVKSDLVPDSGVLLVNSDGLCYSRTTSQPPRLLELQRGGGVTLGETIPGNVMFMYRNQPHAVSSDPSEPGIINLISRERFNFDSLPHRIPEIYGPVVAAMSNETPDDGLSELEISSLGPDSSETPEVRTVRCEYNLSYQVDPGGSIASDGDDLYVDLLVRVEKKEPTYEFFGNFAFEGGQRSVLARYDGERWHILPHGLMAALINGLSGPGGEMFCAHYSGLPKAKSRYTVVSIDTDPFELSL